MVVPVFTLWRTREDSYGNHGHIENIYGQLVCYTIEKRWLNNQNHLSCIPIGKYKVTKFLSPSKHTALTGHNVFLLNDVPGRTMIEIHVANFASELLGCIAVGLDANEKGVGRSALALKKLLDTLPDVFELEIKTMVKYNKD